MTNVDHFSKMTVPRLREILSSDGIKVSTRTKKADLVTYVVNMMDDFHDVALDMNAQFGPAEVGIETETPLDARDLTDMVLKFHFKALHRYNPSEKKDKSGKVILTSAQRRRLHKKVNSFAKKIGFFSYGV